MYTITKIKTFRGMEGYGLNATICRNGKPVAFVMDEGCGGETMIDFTNPLQNGRSYEASKNTWKGEETAFHQFCVAWAKTQDREVPEEERIPAYLAIDWVNHQVDEYQNKKRFDRLATIKKPYCPEIQAFLDKKYPAQVETIYGR
jgi:hypothetical protein